MRPNLLKRREPSEEEDHYFDENAQSIPQIAVREPVAITRRDGDRMTSRRAVLIGAASLAMASRAVISAARRLIRASRVNRRFSCPSGK